MRYHIISIFPELFDSFLKTSLLAKASEKGLISFSFVNPREFCADKQRQVDDEIYGGGVGLLMKAQPIIDAIKFVVSTLDSRSTFAVVMPAPARDYFHQETAHQWTEQYTDIIFICGRYEGIDHRVDLWCRQVFDNNFYKLSLGQWVTLGGEVPAMILIEATARLLPGVINDPGSRQDESYRPEHGGSAIEYPQYTRPEVVEGFGVPEVLLSGHHAEIQKRKEKNMLDNL